MKTIIIISLSYILFSCDAQNGCRDFNGTFVTKSGVKFELKEDSTTFILFDDSIKYEGVWSIHCTKSNAEYANIEFAGNPTYYYLKNNKLYYNERDMQNDRLGTTIQYLD